jgi:hypothetical protein
MFKCGDGLGLVSESPPGFLVTDGGRKELEGDTTVELEVLGLVDHPHTPLTELGEDPIMRNDLPDHRVPPMKSVHHMRSFS